MNSCTVGSASGKIKKNNFFQKLKNYEIDLFLKICRFETLKKVLAWDKFTKLWENVEF